MHDQYFPNRLHILAQSLKQHFCIFESILRQHMKKLFIATVLICASAEFGLGQKGDVTETKDPRVNALVSKQSEVTPPDVKPKIAGFRVQLFFDSDRGAVNNARSRFISEFPRIDTYVEYNAPNYYLKVGDFRTRLEAEKIKAAMTVDFPTSFVLEEDINLPRLRKNNEE